MALRSTLGEILEMVRDETRVSSNSSRGTDHANYLRRLIKRHYQMLADDWDWPHLRIRKEDAGKLTQAGERYYDFPVELRTDRINQAWARHGSDIWIKMDYCISPEQLNQLNSDNSAIRYDPALRWQWYNDRQFEIWPTPTIDGIEIRFEGGRKITELTDDNARADIDDILISLSVAVEVLSGTKQSDAEKKQSAFTQRLFRLRAENSSRKRIQVGIGPVDNEQRVPRITVAYVR